MSVGDQLLFAFCRLTHFAKFLMNTPHCLRASQAARLRMIGIGSLSPGSGLANTLEIFRLIKKKKNLNHILQKIVKHCVKFCFRMV